MLIGVPLETVTGETRVAVTPETAKKLKAQGHTLRIQSGAGVAASVTDEAYIAAGAEITDQAGAFASDRRPHLGTDARKYLEDAGASPLCSPLAVQSVACEGKARASPLAGG